MTGGAVGQDVPGMHAVHPGVRHDDALGGHDGEYAAAEPWLIALDVDGTIMTEGGRISDVTVDAITRLTAAGHHVMIATGRSPAMTLPVLERVGLSSEYVVCSNGAVTLRRDDTAPTGYTVDFVEEFDPTEVLSTVADSLDDAGYAVEDAQGLMLYLGAFPPQALSPNSREATFDELTEVAATRVVVMSPSHSTEEFLGIVESMGLQRVTYNIGWTAWLDIAPENVTKATALERVRELLGVPGSRVMVCGDGRNDIEMLTWAAAGDGRAVAMGQAPDEVIAVASETTGSDEDDGLAAALSTV